MSAIECRVACGSCVPGICPTSNDRRCSAHCGCHWQERGWAELLTKVRSDWGTMPGNVEPEQRLIGYIVEQVARLEARVEQLVAEAEQARDHAIDEQERGL